MIIVPEIETVVILVPRTGSSALRNAVEARYPSAIRLYRHMEADGVPIGYDRWRRVGVVRHPLDRLWSLYRYLQRIGEGRVPNGKGKWEPGYVAVQRESVAMPFNDWLTRNRLVFTSPYDQRDGLMFWPQFCVRHPVAENRKSQFIYLRPDLGTEVYRYGEADRLYRSLDVEPQRLNAAPDVGDRPPLSDEAERHLEAFHRWDVEASGGRA